MVDDPSQPPVTRPTDDPSPGSDPGSLPGEGAEPRADGEAAGLPNEEAQRYSRTKLACSLTEMLLDVGSLFVLVLAGRAIDNWLLEQISLQSPAVRLGGFFGILVVIQAVVHLPLAFYSNWVVEERYGLNRQSLGRWFRRFWLKILLAAALGLFLAEILFAIIWTVGAWWWLVAAIAFFLVTVLLGQLAPVVLLPLFYKVERIEDESLAARFRSLAEGTGLRIEGVYRLQLSDETAKANAMLAGIGATRRVILGDTLLDNFTADEIDVVLAHEIGHHHYRHIPQFLVFGGVMSLGSFVVCDLVLRQWLAAGPEGAGYHSLPVAALPLLLLTITLLSLLVAPIRNAMSRRFERQCDRYALVKTGDPEAYRSAFRKLARTNKADPSPPQLEVLLLHDHPPIEERIALADEFSREKNSQG